MSRKNQFKAAFVEHSGCSAIGEICFQDSGSFAKAIIGSVD